MFRLIDSEIVKSLSSSEIDVLRYIDNHKSEVLNMSIQQLSKEIFISTATIVRLCKKIGFSGFSELKYSLREIYKNNKEKINKDSLESIIDKSIFELTQTINLIDEKEINKVVKLLLSNKNIHFFGKGLTSSAFKYISKQLLTCNRLNICYEDTHIAYLAAEKMTGNDVLFLSSLSGKTKQIIKTAQIAKSKGAILISITNINNNEIASISDINFYVHIEENNAEYDMKSRLPILFILDTIVRNYVNEKIE